MNTMIDRYLYAVTRRLPENMRADVERELRSNIEDMMPQGAGEAQVEEVLTKLGSPARLALRYNPKPRFLVLPELFDDYIGALKAVSITLAVLFAFFAVYKFVFGDIGSLSPVQLMTTVVTNFMSSAFEGVVQAFFWVTLAFYLIGHYGIKKNVRQWTPKNLSDIPPNVKSSFKRADIIGNAFFFLLFSTLFLIGTLRTPTLIAWYEAGRPAAPMFDEQIVRLYLPVFIFLMVLTLVIAVLKCVQGRWTVGIAVPQCLYSISSAALGLTFLNKPGVITEQFAASFADKLHVTLSVMNGYIHTGISVVCVLIIIGTLADIGTTIAKTVRSGG